MELTVNGERRTLEVDPRRTLLSVLREELDLTGAKYGCGQAQCGACTVLVDDLPVLSCVTRVGECAGQSIRTVESFAHGDQLHPVQQAFIDCGAMQCGYCTTGMIVAAMALLEANPQPTESEIIRHMDGNICRCGTYLRIVKAIGQAAASMQAGGD